MGKAHEHTLCDSPETLVGWVDRQPCTIYASAQIAHR
jgi:hypothetical protein